MTDITVSSSTYQTTNRSWLLGEAEGTGGAPTLSTEGLPIAYASFTSGTHYPNGYLPSGLVLALATGGTYSGKLVPYANGGANGAGTAVGLLYNDTKVPTDLTTKASTAYVRAFAAVSESRLPSNSGIDSTAKTALKLIDFRA